MIVFDHAIVFLFPKSKFEKLETTHIKELYAMGSVKRQGDHISPICCAYSMVSNIMYEPCPSKTSRCQFN
jgi:hypothetical protein